MASIGRTSQMSPLTNSLTKPYIATMFIYIAVISTINFWIGSALYGLPGSFLNMTPVIQAMLALIIMVGGNIIFAAHCFVPIYNTFECNVPACSSGKVLFAHLVISAQLSILG